MGNAACCCSEDGSSTSQVVEPLQVSAVSYQQEEAVTVQDCASQPGERPARSPKYAAAGGGSEQEKDPARMDLVFWLPDEQSERTVSFTRRPLGLDFKKQAPITITDVRPGTQGYELGVKEGWVLQSIAGEDLAFAEDFEYVFSRLAKNSTMLKADPSCALSPRATSTTCSEGPSPTPVVREQ